MNPELKIQITNLVTEIFNTKIKDIVLEQLEAKVTNRDKELKDRATAALDEKLSKFSQDALDEAMGRMINKFVGDVRIELKTVNDQVSEMYKGQLPVAFMAKFNELFNRVVMCEGATKHFKLQIESLLNQNFLEIVTNDQLKGFYNESGCTMLDIQEELKVETAHAYRIVNGQVQDPEIRHKLKRYLLKKIQDRGPQYNL